MHRGLTTNFSYLKTKTVMAKKDRDGSSNEFGRVSTSVDELLLAALERDDNSMETGRYIVTLKEGAGEQGAQTFSTQGMRVADSRDFADQATVLESLGDADALLFSEIGAALVSGPVAQERGLSAFAEVASDSPIASVDPEYFVFSSAVYEEYAEQTATDGNQTESYLRGFLKAAETISKDLSNGKSALISDYEEAQALGATWGLNVCRVPPSVRSGAGIRVAVLDTGFDLGHPDFLGRPIVGQTFVGQPVQDLHSHGTHCVGTACGPKAPVGTTPRYGIAHRSAIFVGKVLSNTGGSVGGSVLAGMNWAIANRCTVISMSLGGQGGVQPSFTAAGNAALNNGLLIVAAAGNSNASTGFPANSPSIMSVASLGPGLAPSPFSNFGKIDISGPGEGVFSSVPRPARYGTKSGTSMATPHVAGCAALWAETSPNLRGMALWRQLQRTARPLRFPPARVGAGLVQAP